MIPFRFFLKSDDNWIRITYTAIMVTPGDDLASTKVFGYCSKHGWDTQVNFENWLKDKTLTTGRLGNRYNFVTFNANQIIWAPLRGAHWLESLQNVKNEIGSAP
jgi:hypothetical protein